VGTNLIMMIGYLREGENYGEANKIFRTLTEVAGRGFFVSTFDEMIQTISQGPADKARISSALLAETQAYISGGESYLSAHASASARSELMGFRFGCLSLSRSDEMMLIDVDDWHFRLHASAREDARFPQWRHDMFRRYETWLEMVKLVYQVWHPLYMYDFSGTTLWPETSCADARKLQPQHLYEHNIFGPEFVEHIGRERFQEAAALAWRLEWLDDGGVLLIPNDLYSFNDCRENHMAEIANALNIPYDAGALGKWCLQMARALDYNNDEAQG
jgi:hypothetical protein